MSYINVYPARIDWENEPSINTPINALNLNKMDYALYNIDQTLANWDTTKANQSDLLLCVKSITYDTDTGVFVFTWQNGTTQTVDLNIEKIPVSFSMDANGVITMTTEDGTTYTADVGALIKTYTFTDSSVIDFTVTTDASGNKTVTADIVDGSITGTKLQPNYLADCQTAATNAGNSANSASGSASDSEAWAVGTRGGVPVPSSDPAYENNSYYWSQHGGNSLTGLNDVNITTPTDGQALVYDATNQEWVNGAGGGGGSSTLAGLSDVDITTPTAGQSLVYNLTSQEWDNKDIHKEVTKAEYEALVAGGNVDPDIVYMITDGVLTTAPVDDSVVSGQSTWSSEQIGKFTTTEKMVGEWIDGKPIYRVVIPKTSPTTGLQQDLSGYNIAKIVRYEVYTSRTSSIGSQIICGNFIDPYDSTNNFITNIVTTSAWYCNFAYSGTVESTTLILEYTKTTD